MLEYQRAFVGIKPQKRPRPMTRHVRPKLALKDKRCLNNPANIGTGIFADTAEQRR